MKIKEVFWDKGWAKSGAPAYIAYDNILGIEYEYSNVYEEDAHSDELRSCFEKEALMAFTRIKNK